MTSEHVWLLLRIAPPVLWMICASYRSRAAGRLVIKIFGILLLLAFGLTGCVPRKPSVAGDALAQALTGLSGTDLKQGRRRYCEIETNA